MPDLLSLIESPNHPNFSFLYQRLGIREQRVSSLRKAIGLLKRQPLDFVVAEFFYGYGNNYAGVNVSNLDVFLASLQKYSPQARVIVMVEPSQRCYVDKLARLFTLHAVLPQPVAEADIWPWLEM
jgi:hypothetical protein